MSTYMAKANEVEKKWYIIDAAGKPLGRVAATAATILRGKHRPEYTPNADCGEYVIVINAKDAVLTGNNIKNNTFSCFDEEISPAQIEIVKKCIEEIYSKYSRQK